MTVDERDQNTLFDRNVYISKEIQSALPSSHLIRPLRRDDDERGFIELLSQLSVAGSITQESFKARFDLLKEQGSTYVVVIEEDNRIVASATLLVEYKFLRECGIVGHIEDVVVHDSQRGKKLGIRLIDQLHCIAQTVKCYKTILDCNEKNIPFYEKCLLKKTDVQMTRYF
ncbi:uncharacterized protein ATC70_000611 [Mucor velutinosus]|uniref:Glucosamine 6-phosphate N-acetyltransferase n=1 Tax=Mucor velutinosus TaxID=708070 RepID=A0AAN7DHS8_9FUNG|nr:hypothetical protein ATC70_000611 [Mucor velutinosus]